MGVKKLWPLLPHESNVPVSSLKGKTFAVDLSSWIIEFNTAKRQTTLYLRNIFHRTNELLRYGIIPVYVADGRAPAVKLEAMKKRKEAEFGEEQPVDLDRTLFRVYCGKCEQLLKRMGVPFLYSAGEGEALCAALNRAGLVDGVMTNDSDAFLYGAKMVYRNYKHLNKMVSTIEVYSMDEITEKLKLNRRDLVTMALLAGCDYNASGVGGAGPQRALKLLEKYRKYGLDSITRLREWRYNMVLHHHDDIKPPHCQDCKHWGKKKDHTDVGCIVCHTNGGCRGESSVTCGCMWHENHLEYTVRKKAIEDPSFPSEALIQEFLLTEHHLQGIDKSQLLARPMQLQAIKTFAEQNGLKQVGQDFYNKIAPTLAHLLLLDMNVFLTDDIKLKPVGVEKCCKIARRPCVEVSWKKLEFDDTSELRYYTFPVPYEKFTEMFPDFRHEFCVQKKCADLKRKGGRPQYYIIEKKKKQDIPYRPTLKNYFPAVKVGSDPDNQLLLGCSPRALLGEPIESGDIYEFDYQEAPPDSVTIPNIPENETGANEESCIVIS